MIAYSVFYGIKLYRIADGGFNTATGGFVSGKKGTDFWGFVKGVGRAVAVEVKKDRKEISDKSLFFTLARRKMIEPIQVAVLNEISANSGLALVSIVDAQNNILTWLWPICDNVICNYVVPVGSNDSKYMAKINYPEHPYGEKNEL